MGIHLNGVVRSITLMDLPEGGVSRRLGEGEGRRAGERLGDLRLRRLGEGERFGVRSGERLCVRSGEASRDGDGWGDFLLLDRC